MKDSKVLVNAFRSAAHAQLDRWIDQQQPLFEAKTLPTLRQMSEHFIKARTMLLSGCLQEMATQLTLSYH